MFSLLIAIHIIACAGLIFFILIQQGKGGGLIESFSSAESIFGSKTNTFLTKATAGLAITFFLTCLSLAFMSVQQSKSVVDRLTSNQKAAVAARSTKEEADKATGQASQAVQKTETQSTEKAQPQESQATKVTENTPPVTTETENNAAVDTKQQN